MMSISCTILRAEQRPKQGDAGRQHMTWPQETEAEAGGHHVPVTGVKNRKVVERRREGRGKGEGRRGREGESLAWPNVHLA